MSQTIDEQDRSASDRGGAPLSQALLCRIESLLAQIDYGEITIVVRSGCIAQIETSEIERGRVVGVISQ